MAPLTTNKAHKHMVLYPGLLRIIITISAVLGLVALATLITYIYRLRRRRQLACTESQAAGLGPVTVTVERPAHVIRLDSYASIVPKPSDLTPPSPSVSVRKNPFLGAGEVEAPVGKLTNNPSMRRPHTSRTDSFSLPSSLSSVPVHKNNPFVEAGVGEVESVPASGNPTMRRPHTSRMDSFTLPGPTSFTRIPVYRVEESLNPVVGERNVTGGHGVFPIGEESRAGEGV